MRADVRDFAKKLGLSNYAMNLAMSRAELNKFIVRGKIVDVCPQFIRNLFDYINLRKRATSVDMFEKYEKAQNKLIKMYKQMTSEAI